MADNRRPILCFDGSKGYVDLGMRPEHKVSRDITMEAWIYVNRQIKNAGILSRIYDTGTTESGYGLFLDGSSGLFCAIRTTSGPSQSFYYSSGPDTIQLNQWHHVAATYNGRDIIIYIDGIEKNRVANAGEIIYTPDNALTIGAYKDNDETILFPGRIADVRLWNVARTAEQICGTMGERLLGGEPGLVGCWPLIEGTGDVVLDVSPCKAMGKIMAGTRWDRLVVPFASPALETMTRTLDIKLAEQTIRLDAMMKMLDELRAGGMGSNTNGKTQSGCLPRESIRLVKDVLEVLERHAGGCDGGSGDDGPMHAPPDQTIGTIGPG